MTNSSVRRASPRLAAVFSPVVIRALSRESIAERDRDKIARVAAVVEHDPLATLADAFEEAHQQLLRDYRSEYVFKNEVVSRVVFGRHSPTTASALLELTMGASCADVVVVNGTSTVYEIKTDLDQFSRLGTQLKDYASRAEMVYVVTSIGRVESALDRIPPHIGVLGLRRNGSLSTAREASSNIDRLVSAHLFEMLRAAEARTIVSRLYGWTPPVDQARAWLESRDLFASLDPELAHAEVVKQLRGRASSAQRLVAGPDFPRSLRALAYMGHHSNIGVQRIHQRLRSRASLYLGLDGA